jgi:hypothetical protein
MRIVPGDGVMVSKIAQESWRRRGTNYHFVLPGSIPVPGIGFDTQCPQLGCHTLGPALLLVGALALLFRSSLFLLSSSLFLLRPSLFSFCPFCAGRNQPASVILPANPEVFAALVAAPPGCQAQPDPRQKRRIDFGVGAGG